MNLLPCNRFGYVKLQETINKNSYHQLESYVDKIFMEDNVLLSDMGALRTEIWSNRAKNVRILSLSEKIAQSLYAIRFTSCKSGKDRTSMSATLEEARLCTQLFGISEFADAPLFQRILDTLRRYFYFLRF